MIDIILFKCCNVLLNLRSIVSNRSIRICFGSVPILILLVSSAPEVQSNGNEREGKWLWRCRVATNRIAISVVVLYNRFAVPFGPGMMF